MMGRPGDGTRPGGEWGDWLSPADAWERVRAAWNPALLPAEDVALPAALRRVLATDLHAPLDSPTFDRSAMDGYALRAADTAAAASAAAYLAYVGDVAMGTSSEVVVGAGQAAWVATGSMIPRGADSVVMVERTSRDGASVRIDQVAQPGENVVPRGADLRAGDLVLRAGHRVRPQDTAVIASMGLAVVAVRRRPRVAIIAGGDELVPPGESLAPGQIYDSNSFAMAAQVEEWGGSPTLLPHVADRPEAVEAALRQGMAEGDMVLLSGGSSVGLKDLTAAAIDALGRPGVIVHGLAMRPGRPTIAGVVDGVLVIGIPGNPVSAMVACEVLARPAIEALLGLQPARVAGVVGDHAVYGRLAEPVRSQAGRQDYVRVRLERDAAGALEVYPVPGGSGIIRSMVDADGLLVAPPERAALEQGEMVEVRLF